jgi:hypothetical protein
MKILEFMERINQEGFDGNLQNLYVEAIKELKIYQSSMDNYLHYSTGGRYNDSFGTSTYTLKQAHDDYLRLMLLKDKE